MPDPLASRDRGFSAVVQRTDSPGRAITWPEVLRALPGDAARSEALRRYRARGHLPDDFARLRSARAAMAVALSHVEDTIELRPGGRLDAERAAIRDLRRRLEAEL